MSHGSNEFDGTVGHEKPLFIIKATAFGGSLMDDLPDERAVLRVGSLYHQLERRIGRGIELEYSKCFIGPEDLSARDVPAETARTAQPLGLRQVTLALTQRSLGPLALGPFFGLTQRALN